MGGQAMKYLILGKGYLGTYLIDYFKADFLDKRIEDMKEKDFEGYDVVINTIAKSDVDWCEKNDCFKVNTKEAVRIAKLVQGKYVFISTGCIFPKPLCKYTWSKYYAEPIIRIMKRNHLIIRPRLLMSEKSHPRNTITKILKYPVLSSNQESMTIIEDMLPALKKMIDQNKIGTFNMLNKGSISPSEIATIFGKKHEVKTHEEIQRTSGKAKRTSVVLKGHLPNIITRIKEIQKKWQ